MSRYTSDTGIHSCAGFNFSFVFKSYLQFEELAALAPDYDLLAVTGETVLPGLDITLLYEKLNPAGDSFLLESLAGTDNGRYSIIGCYPLFTLATHNYNECEPQLRDFLASLRVPNLGMPHFTGGLVGFWGYDQALTRHKLVSRLVKGLLPAQRFMVPGEVLVFDRLETVLKVVVWLRSREFSKEVYQAATERIKAFHELARTCCREPEPYRLVGNHRDMDSLFAVNADQETFCRWVETAKKHIVEGDIFQVVLSRRWHKASTADPWQVYRVMRHLNPSPYMFFLKNPDFILLGSSPEMQVKVADGSIHLRPIAGTRKVTGDPAQDRELREELLHDEKERSEHLMLVDLGRNDVGRVSLPGTVKVHDFMKIEPYSHVVHLVSSITGRLLPELDALDAFNACFPAGTLTGAPKRKAMEIIDGLETQPRQAYGGAVGYLDFNGTLDSCITIRSILYHRGRYYLQTGAGIVADSVPQMEHEETLNKARILMLAILEAEAMTSDHND